MERFNTTTSADWLSDIAEALDLYDYDEREIVDVLDIHTTEAVYTYHLDAGDVFIEAVSCCGDEFAEINEATLAAGDGDEYDLLPYLRKKEGGR